MKAKIIVLLTLGLVTALSACNKPPENNPSATPSPTTSPESPPPSPTP